jgi:hypothetical protein
VCTEELCVEFRRTRVVDYSVRKISARSASSRRTPGGREVFIVQEILWILSLTKSENARHAWEIKIFKEIKLRRSNSKGA